MRRHTRTRARGFTVLEMAVVLAIISILMAVVLFNQNEFNRTSVLTDTAYTVALSIREMQSYGLSSASYSTSGGEAVYDAGYGVHFSSNWENASSQYEEFVDTSESKYGSNTFCPTGSGPAGNPSLKAGNCEYDDSSENLRNFMLTSSYTIPTGGLCGVDTNNNYFCIGNGNALNIVFLRPNTQTILTSTNDTGSLDHTSNKLIQLSKACIEIQAPGGAVKYIEVTQQGQIEVTSSCP